MDYSDYSPNPYDPSIPYDEDDHFFAPQPLAEGQYVPPVVKAKHPRWGTHGPEFYGPNGGLYVWQRRGDKIVRGWKRKGIRAEEWTKETVYSNEKTSPLVEVPRVIIESMSVDNTVRARDLAVFFRLFGEARIDGIGSPGFGIPVRALMDYLGIQSTERVRDSLKRIDEATATYRFGHPGGRGKHTLRLAEISFPVGDDERLRAHHIINFRFPAVFVAAVQHSRDFGLVDVNALSRFTCKFTIPLYLRLCLKAGHHARKRRPIQATESELKAMLGFDPATRPCVFRKAMEAVRADLRSLSGPRKRFRIGFESWMESDGHLSHLFVVGNPERKLVEVKPAEITDKTLEKIALEDEHMPVEPHQNPRLMLFRRAATIVKRPISVVYRVWRVDVWGAAGGRHDHVIGLPSADFLDLIDEQGVNSVFELWVGKRDFGVPLSLKQADTYDPAQEPGYYLSEGPCRRKRRKKVVLDDGYVCNAYADPDEVDDLAVYADGDNPYEDMPVISDAADDDTDIPY